MRNISAWSIKNPVPPLVLFTLLMLAGVLSFRAMDINNQPDIEFPGAQVIVAQPGAAPEELENQVTQRVEAAVRNITGVDEVNSFVSEGSSRTMVQFAIGTPIDRAVNDVRDAVANIRSDLPQGILQPQVNRLDIAGGPIAYFSVESTAMTLEELSWFVDNTVAKRLLGIPGMAQVRRSGGVSREIRVILDPDRMQAYGVTASQVNAQLRQVNLNAAGGRAEIAGAEQSVRVMGNARNAVGLGDTQINLGQGRSIRLGDIAEVRDGYAEQRSISKLNGRQVLSFSMAKAKGSSDVTVYDAALKEIDVLRKQYPKISFQLIFTSVEYTKNQYNGAIDAMIEGAILAVLVVWLFLRDWRATMISALAIPLSAIPTFWVLDVWLGFSLNQLSLLALSLVAGVLVDDAIVEIENIVRHMRMGKSAYQASMDAADEIGLAVVATTMSIVAVFLPVALMPGISGQFFKNFGATVAVSVLISLGVARLITPMLAAYFLKSEGQAEHGTSKWIDSYMRILNWALANRMKTVFGIGGTALALTVALFAMLPMTFQPDVDNENSQVTIALPPGGRPISVTLTGNDPALLDRSAQQVVAEMRGMPELRQARIDGGLQRPEITIKPRLDLASELGVTTAALSETIRIATLGDIDQNVAKFSVADRQIPIRVALAEASLRNLSTIENLPVPTSRGGTVPLKVVAEISFGAGPTEIRRFNQQRRIQIGADLAPGLLSGDVQTKVNKLPSLKSLPPGVEKVQLGMQKWLGELVQNFILAVIAGVVMVFAVLVLLYKRVLPPFVNMMSLLLAPLGGLIALTITGNPISMPVFIGLLMLLGIVAKNSILLVDMAIEEMEKGVPKLEAILEAGHKRVQPIVMTTVAMVAGMMPVALALGGDGSQRAPMGIVVIGGLIVSTALTLIIVPAGFSIAVSVEEWLAPRMKRWFTNNEGTTKLPGALNPGVTPAE